MAKANFKDTSTGKFYYITGFTVTQRDGKWIDVDGDGNQLLGEDGSPLTSIPPSERVNEADENIITTVALGYGTEARKKDIKAIRRISKTHNRSDEARHTRGKSIKREVG